jgi:RNA polymerase sigma-70 factor (ECF subfamily)
MWTVLEQAHAEAAEATARQVLLDRYGGAVHRYLLAALRDPHAADDLAQEFALNLVRGAFHNVNPERGRFRDYVKTVLFHLVSQYRQKLKRRGQPLSPESPEISHLAAPLEDPLAAFNESWRQDLLARAWEALAQTQPTFYEVLRHRAAHPALASGPLAEQLSSRLGKSLTAAGVRQTLRRARERFADLLIEQVAHSLRSPAAEQIEQELRELNLLAYCQPALARYQKL